MANIVAKHLHATNCSDIIIALKQLLLYYNSTKTIDRALSFYHIAVSTYIAGYVHANNINSGCGLYFWNFNSALAKSARPIPPALLDVEISICFYTNCFSCKPTMDVSTLWSVEQ